MKNTFQNNDHDWVRRLREHRITSSRPNSKEETWKKIQQRLHPAPKRKRSRWYWIAAAFIINLLALTPYFNSERINDIYMKAVTKRNKVEIEKKQVDALVETAARAAVPAKAPVIKMRLPLVPSKDSFTRNESFMIVDHPAGILPDTQLVREDVVSEPEEMPTIYINDIHKKEKLPENISLKSIGVKQMIRLFGTDMTSEQSSKKNQNIPERQTINQN
ncbi:MAG: hypothetical protein QM737_16105 [Ferruginibacter sp.]